MKPSELASYLDRLVRSKLKLSTMIWGAPGIGKSSIVAQTARAHRLDFIDLRLSQLAPTDLRGLPVAAKGVSRWYPPEFLPRKGAGVLFLDEINLAPPTMQGMAQQLILDRRVGSYVVPKNWYIWAAGNRSEDRAAVFEMPAPLANRFIHLEVHPDFESFKAYALARNLHEQVVAFLSFRPELLHKLDPEQPAWPSPRSWEMGNLLHRAGLSIASAVGIGAATEFEAYVRLYRDLPDLEMVLYGSNRHVAFPEEPSLRYAIVVGLVSRSDSAVRAFNALKWLAHNAPLEWVQLCATDLLRKVRGLKQMTELQTLIAQDGEMQTWMREYRRIAGELGTDGKSG
jgi:MoxR-like ATPase